MIVNEESPSSGSVFNRALQGSALSTTLFIVFISVPETKHLVDKVCRLELDCGSNK